MNLCSNAFLYKTNDGKKACVYDKYTSKIYSIPVKVFDDLSDIDISKINMKLSVEPVEKKVKHLQHLRLLITNRCNMNCIYCYADGGNYNLPESDMNIETMKETVKLFYEKYDYINQISFFGGEPLCNFNLIRDTVIYIRKYCLDKLRKLPSFSFVTNGTLLTDEIINFIKENNISVIISLDGPKEVNDRQRRFKNSTKSVFDEIYPKLKKLRKVQNFTIESTYTNLLQNDNISSNSIADYLTAEFNVARINICKVMMVRDVDKTLECSDFESSINHIDRFFNNVYSGKYIFDDRIIALFNLFHTGYYCNEFCDAGDKQFTVSMNGDIYPCQLFAGKEEYKLGNIEEKKINMIKDLNLFRNKNNPKCQKCGNKRFCNACFAELQTINSINYCNDLDRNINYFLEKVLEIKLSDPKKYLQLIDKIKNYYQMVSVRNA